MENYFNDEISDAKVLDFSMEIFKKKLKSLIGYQILFIIIMTLGIIAAGVILLPILFEFHFGGTFALIILICIILIIGGTFVGISKAGIFHMTYGYLEGKNLTAADALGKAFASFKATIRVVTLLTIALVPLMFGMVFIGLELSSIPLWQSRIQSSVFLSFLFNILLNSFIAALVGSYLIYMLHIAIFEEKTAIQALKKSIKLAKGEVFRNIFRIFTIFIIQWGINIAIFSAIAAASSLLYFILGRMQAGHSLITEIMLYIDTIKPFTDFILGILLEPIGAIIWTLYYVNIRYKKEGFKIYKMLHNLQQQKKETSPVDLDTNTQ